MAKRLDLSGERFAAVYRLEGDRDRAEATARRICLEQTVEYPDDLIDCSDIREQIFGRLVSLEPSGEERFDATIAYPSEAAGRELTQLLNVLFGNISLEPGIRLLEFDLPPGLAACYRGPRFGREGLRRLAHAERRPLLCSAIKPMGLPIAELAELAYELARGGMDFVKDDHGLNDQSFCRFEQRVERCAEAVERANRESGGHCRYAPNVTAPFDQLSERVRLAARVGAGAVVISPGLTGFDAMRSIADDDDSSLPVFAHPAFLGGFSVGRDSGISHGALFGRLMRLAGADAAIFPNYGGRFSFTREDCRELVDGTLCPLGNLAPAFPVPAGGMKLENVEDMIDFYGRDVVLLIGGDLHRHGPDLAATCRRFASLVREISD